MMKNAYYFNLKVLFLLFKRFTKLFMISLRSKPELVIHSVNSILKSKNSIRYFGSVIWNSLPIEIREDHSISSFVTKIKQWKPIACPCTICKSYIGRVGYIKVSDYESISITVSKHLRKELKILKICGISVLSNFIVNVPYLCRFTIS